MADLRLAGPPATTGAAKLNGSRPTSAPATIRPNHPTPSRLRRLDEGIPWANWNTVSDTTVTISTA
ncbi:MAG: hypothetical protein ABIQ39_09755, partial [Ilumatobacteraceae bacterium]